MFETTNPYIYTYMVYIHLHRIFPWLVITSYNASPASCHVPQPATILAGLPRTFCAGLMPGWGIWVTLGGGASQLGISPLMMVIQYDLIWFIIIFAEFHEHRLYRRFAIAFWRRSLRSKFLWTTLSLWYFHCQIPRMAGKIQETTQYSKVKSHENESVAHYNNSIQKIASYDLTQTLASLKRRTYQTAVHWVQVWLLWSELNEQPKLTYQNRQFIRIALDCLPN